MKCEFCNGNLSLEDVNCPHCGKPNKHAQKHVQDMTGYAERYDKTEQEVYATTRRFSDTVVRTIIVAVLAVLLVVLLIVRSNVFEICSAISENQNYANRKSHIENMDGYLAEKDYLGLYYYCENNEISSLDKGFEEYQHIIRGADYYCLIYEHTMDLISSLAKEPEELDEPVNFDRLGSYLDYFYRNIINDEYYDGSEESVRYSKQCIGEMRKDVDALMMTYCNVPEDKIEEFAQMSEAQRTVFIEECMTNER